MGDECAAMVAEMQRRGMLERTAATAAMWHDVAHDSTMRAQAAECHYLRERWHGVSTAGEEVRSDG